MFDCRLCEKVLSDESSAVEDTILLENTHFVCVPPLGALVPGYVLIASKRHVTAISDFSDREAGSLSAILTRLKRLSPYRAGFLIFEHGSPNALGGGACIEHYHLHLCPNIGLTISDIEDHLPVPRSRLLLADILDLRTLTLQSGYVLVGDEVQTICYFSDEIPSQLIRKIIAQHVGIDNQWNWTIFPHDSNIQETIRLLQQS